MPTSALAAAILSIDPFAMMRSALEDSCVWIARSSSIFASNGESGARLGNAFGASSSAKLASAAPSAMDSMDG